MRHEDQTAFNQDVSNTYAMASENPDVLLSKIVNVIRAASSLAAQDVDFYRNLDRDFSNILQSKSNKLTEMVNGIVHSIDEHHDSLELKEEEISDLWKDFGNIMDNLLEKSDHSLDNLNRTSNSNNSAADLQYLGDFSGKDSHPTKRVEKPQLKFRTPIDNSESHPFLPLLKEKPNALKPLSDSLRMIETEENSPGHYPHPYEYEIDHQEYNSSILQIKQEIPSKSWDASEPIWIDSKAKLDSMLEHLKNAQEIAVDLEHHDYRSYYGIVCLMQISTREQDYLVDTIELREDLHILNEVFTDPLIVKVFHGAFMDIIWLQRDLGLYVVGLFDTYHASKAIGLPRHSLAYLLENFANFKTSKKYQLADWRIRPLSKPMTAYARADTHFLLNIYDQLRNKLIESNKLAGVLYESRNVAKRRFEYSKYRPITPSSKVYSPTEKENPWRVLMYQYNIAPEREELVKALYEWRDVIARRDDESPRFIMPNQLLAALVAYTPTDVIGVVSLTNGVTDHVRQNATILANLIKSTLRSMKDTHKESAAIVSSELKSNSASLEAITVPQIRNIMDRFSVFSSNSVTEDRSMDSTTSSILLGKILPHEEGDVVYEDRGIPHKVEVEDVRGRAQRFNSALAALEDIKFEVEKPVDVEKSEKVKIETTPEPQTKTENPDEVIVLKKKQIHKKEAAKRSSAAAEEAVDYSKMPDVLSNKPGQNNRQQRKRRFDPSFNESEGPRAPKKKRPTTRGKNVSFKR
ncbi:exosome nuclease subunit RRP6 [Saccharomyces eubayanus]|uniref:exosome nuclease subunit RRP6 n=1 Tax=Saccharomyces eubayanus TaxID=1080349 RepID=UPI0006C2B51F|nr:RRP6-like protein [Saccharomyces eubayanus]KOG99067.1 RRP6-like protein [Saccharomyces eubayanus]